MIRSLRELIKVGNLIKGYVAYNYKLTKNFNSPTVLLIETTNKCNLACGICPRRKMTRPDVIMPLELFKKAIDETKRYTRFIWLHHLGEPLLDPLLEERIRYCKKHNIGVGISTNATLLSEKKSRMLLSSGLDKIILCMDGVKKETYEKVRKNANYEKTVENIRNFLDIRKRSLGNNLYVMLQIINMNETQDQIDDFKDMWKNYNVNEIIVKKFNTWGSQVDGIANQSESGYFKIRHAKYRTPCYYLWHSVVILADGRVVQCCREYDARIVLGDLKKQTLKEIWNSRSMQKLRDEHIKGKFNNGVCDNCIEYPDITPTRFLITVNNLKRGLRHIKRRTVG